MVDPRCVDYIRANKDKYPLDALKAALLKAGASPADVEEAARLAVAPLPEIPLTAPPMRRSPATFAEIFPAAASPAPVDVSPAPADVSPAPAAAAAQAPTSGAKALAQGILPRARSVILDPVGFFRTMPRSGGWTEPMVFLLVMSVVNALLRLVLGLAFGLFGSGMSVAAAALFAGLFAAFGALIVVPIGAVIAAGIAHLIWTFLGSRQPFETSLRCVAFMAALMPVQAVVQSLPVVGPWLAIPVSLYGIYLFLPASTEVHEVEKNKATTAVLVLGGIVLLWLLVATFAVWKLRRMAPQARAMKSLIEASQTQSAFRVPAGSPAALQQQVMTQLAQLQARGAAAGAAAGAAPGQPPSPAEAMQAMSAALGALGADSSVKAVAAQGLQALLPAQAAGLARAGTNSGKQKLGAMEMAAAEGTYRTADGGTIMIQIIDAGSYSSLLSVAWNAAGSMPGQSAVTYKSCPGVEQYDRQSRSGSLQIIAAQRFAVRVSGQNVDQKVLRAAMDSVDLDALGRLAR